MNLGSPSSIDYLRPDLSQALGLAGLQAGQLNTNQILLLSCDGTLTPMIAALVGEPIVVDKLSEMLVPPLLGIDNSDFDQHQPVLERKVFLKSQHTCQPWLYAESWIATANLPLDFQNELLESNQAIGNLWLKYRIETFKEIKQVWLEAAENLGTAFAVPPTEQLLCRRYAVFSNQKLLMVICEKFPISYFR